MTKQNTGVALEIMSRCTGEITEAQLTETLAEAFEEYVTGGLDAAALHAKYPDVPIVAFRYAARKLGWLQRRREYLEEVSTAADIALAQSLLVSRREVSSAISTSLLPLVPKLAAQLEDAFDRVGGGDERDEYAVSDIRRLSEAVKFVSDTLIKASGGEHGFITQAGKGVASGGDAQVPWMSIVSKGPLSITTGPEQKAQHVEEGEYEDVN